jgi:hypothetical protein
MRFDPPHPATVVVGTTKHLQLMSSCPAPEDLSIDLRSSDQSAVYVPKSVSLGRGIDRVYVPVTGKAVGEPESRTAVVTASARGHINAEIDIWVGSSSSRWSVAVHGPASGRQPEIQTVAVHAALLRTGQVLVWAYDEDDWSNLDKGNSALWSPTSDVVTAIPLTRNLFCAGNCFLPDGRLLVVGGQSASQTVGQVVAGTFGWGGLGSDHDVHTFEPSAARWVRHSAMPAARWYPTCTTLPNGEALIVSGFWSHRHSLVNDDYEIFSPVTNVRSERRKFLPDICLFPAMFVLPDGALFCHSRSMTVLFRPNSTASGPLGRSITNVFFTRSTTTRNYPGAGCFVLLPLRPRTGYQANVLVFGGGGTTQDGLSAAIPATASSELFTYRPEAASMSGWTTTGALRTARFMADGVLLPTGEVLAVGGVGRGTADDCSNPVLSAEVFDPDAQAWTRSSDMSVPRYYHQTALLLPDARVMVAGSTGGRFHPDFGGGNANEYRIEVMEPSYLFSGPRPTIDWAPVSATWGQNVEIYTASARELAEVVVMRVSSVTHQVNTDQRLVELRVLDRFSDRVRVQLPPSASIAPPGWYMLFVLSSDGVPSRASFVRLSGSGW